MASEWIETQHGPDGARVLVMRTISQATPGRVTYDIVQVEPVQRTGEDFPSLTLARNAALEWLGIDRPHEPLRSAGVPSVPGVLPSDWMALQSAARAALDALTREASLLYVERTRIVRELRAALHATYEVDHTLDALLDGGAR